MLKFLTKMLKFLTSRQSLSFEQNNDFIGLRKGFF